MENLFSNKLKTSTLFFCVSHNSFFFFSSSLGALFDLVFNFHADVVGMVLSWQVIDVKASKCSIKILGIKIISFCGVIEKALKKGINELSAGALKILVPQLTAKLENAINTKVGSVVRIPIKLSTEIENDVGDNDDDNDNDDAMELYSED